MNILEKHVVYKLNKVMGNKDHLALEKVDFKGKSNSFDSEKEAIQSLIDDEKTYEDYVILKTVFIRH